MSLNCFKLLFPLLSQKTNKKLNIKRENITNYMFESKNEQSWIHPHHGSFRNDIFSDFGIFVCIMLKSERQQCPKPKHFLHNSRCVGHLRSLLPCHFSTGAYSICYIYRRFSNKKFYSQLKSE